MMMIITIFSIYSIIYRMIYTYIYRIMICIYIYIYTYCALYIWLKPNCCFAPVFDVSSTQKQDQAAPSRFDLSPLLFGQGRHGNVVRSTCWYVRNGCSCEYTYGNARVGLTRTICSQFKDTMEDLTALVFSSLAPGLSDLDALDVGGQLPLSQW